MDKAIFVVGVGGTGGLLVPKLARLLFGTGIDLWLMDGDIVEKSNVGRQPYQAFNINEKKSAALARKIMTNYDLNVYDYSKYLTGNEIKMISEDECYEDIVIIGCVDNHSTRIILENQFNQIENCMYIDSANGERDGSVFITKNIKGKKHGDLRSDIFPEIKKINDHPTGTCSRAIANGNMQQMVTNDIMANSIAYVIYDWLMQEEQTGVIMVDGFDRFFTADKA